MKFLSRLFISLACISLLVEPVFAQVVPSIPYNLTNGSVADATQVMGNFNTIVTDVNANAATNGVNSNITSITGLTTPLAHALGGTATYTGGTTGGSANAQTLAAVVPANFALTAGNIVTGIAGFTNTGASTLSVNGGAATAMRKNTASGLIALGGGEIVIGSAYMWLYDGTFFELLNSASVANGVTGPGSSTSGDIATFNGTSGVVIQDSGILPSSLIRTVKVQVFPSTATYTPCTGLLYADVQLWGGGGGGGGATGGNIAAGGGGGAGGYTQEVISAATIGSSQSVTIGAAGSAGASGGGNGGTGGTSSFGAILTATGGAGGTGATSSGGGISATPAAGGAGGAGSGGVVNTVGVGGGPGFVGNTGGDAAISGFGGATILGGSGISVLVSSGSSVGGAGTANSGSGGSGASVFAAASAIGGTGGTGYAVVTQYCNQ